MPRRILGLDLGATAVRGVLLESAYRGFAVLDAAALPIAAPEVDPAAPLRDRQAAAVRELVAARRWTFESAVVALPGSGASSHLVTLPFSDARRVEQTVGFEVEGQIPYDLAEVAWDWQIVGTHEGRSDVLVAVARREEVAGVLAALAGAGVDPQALVPAAAAYASLLAPGVTDGPEPPADGAVDVVLDVGASRTCACVASAAGLEWARTIALGAADAARTPAALARELRTTLRGFRARQPGQPRPVRRLLLAGEAPAIPGLVEALAGDAGEAAPLALAAAHAAKIDDAPRFALALALAVRGWQGGRAPRLNLRRGELAYTRDFQHVRGRVVRLASYAGLVLLLALVSASVRTFALAREETALNRALCDATQRIVGKCYEDFSVAESVLRGRGTPAGAIPKVSALDVFGELARRAPADVPLRFDRIEIGRDKLHLQGTTDAAENVDRIVSALRASRCFGDARSGGARRRGAEAKFEFTIDSDVTCETAAPATATRAP